MGLGGISIWQLLIVLLIVVLLFGTRKLKGMGSDLGGAIKGFKNALNEDDRKDEQAADEVADDATAEPEQTTAAHRDSAETDSDDTRNR